MLYLTESEVRGLLPMSKAIPLMRAVFLALGRGDAQNQPRRRLEIPSGAVLHQMAGSIGKYFGIKLYATHVKHGAHFWFHLFHAETARPLAILEANWLGQIRTGAATGFATSLLARHDARSLGVIGTGFQARSQLDAVATVRRLDIVRVFSRDEAKRKRFASEMSAITGLPVEAVDTAEAAVRDMDIVTTSTYAKNPVMESDWVSDGAHVNAMGSNSATRRELPEALLSRASLIAVDSVEQARIESGDLLLASDATLWQRPKLRELADLALNGVPTREPGAVTVFKSTGLAVQDAAAAGFVYQLARERGIGEERTAPL